LGLKCETQILVSVIQRTGLGKNTKKNENKFREKLVVPYTYGKRFQSFKINMHQVYDATCKKSTAVNAKMIIRSQNRRTTKKTHTQTP
jgi:hypothetical protein